MPCIADYNDPVGHREYQLTLEAYGWKIWPCVGVVRELDRRADFGVIANEHLPHQAVCFSPSEAPDSLRIGDKVTFRYTEGAWGAARARRIERAETDPPGTPPRENPPSRSSLLTLAKLVADGQGNELCVLPGVTEQTNAQYLAKQVLIWFAPDSRR